MGRQRRAQFDGGAVRITVEIVERRHDRRFDFVERRQRGLVAGQFHGFAQAKATQHQIERRAGYIWRH